MACGTPQSKQHENFANLFLPWISLVMACTGCNTVSNSGSVQSSNRCCCLCLFFTLHNGHLLAHFRNASSNSAISWPSSRRCLVTLDTNHCLSRCCFSNIACIG